MVFAVVWKLRQPVCPNVVSSTADTVPEFPLAVFSHGSDSSVRSEPSRRSPLNSSRFFAMISRSSELISANATSELDEMEPVSKVGSATSALPICIETWLQPATIMPKATMLSIRGWILVGLAVYERIQLIFWIAPAVRLFLPSSRPSNPSTGNQ